MKQFKLLKFPSLKKPTALYACAVVEGAEQGRAKEVRLLEGTCEKQEVRFHAEEVSTLVVGDLVLVVGTTLGCVVAHKLVNNASLPRARLVERAGIIASENPVLRFEAESIVLQASEDMILLAPDLKLN